MSGARAVACKDYDITVRRETLKAWRLAGTAYSVQLAGHIDERWLAAFRALRSDTVGLVRFHLDSKSRMIIFACRSGDGPADIASVIGSLEELVKLTNLYASGPDAGLDHA